MRNLKNCAVISIACFILTFSNVKAQAEDIGVVDVNKIFTNYSKAQELTTNIKVQETDAQKDIKLAKTPADKKKLEDKYTKLLEEKKVAFKTEKLQQLKGLEADILGAINVSVASKNIKYLFKKESMIVGGEDITSDVLSKLNSSASKK